jgi:hypothetical protein
LSSETTANQPQGADDAAPASDDERLLAAILALDGRPGWLFTVVATWGASPRPPGAMLLLDADGQETGSVSGGCVEAICGGASVQGSSMPACRAC